MKKDYTEIGLILDCSGSMMSIKKSIIDGFNTFIEEQKNLDGKCVVTLTTFSDDVKISEPAPLEKIELLNSTNYRPGGMTALWKAIVDTVDTMGHRFTKMEDVEKPEKILVVIITDGEENASNNDFGRITRSAFDYTSKPFYTLEKVKDTITHQKEKYSWEFIFIGTETLDVQGMSKSMGIDHSYAFKQDLISTRSMYEDLSATTASYRTTGNVDINNLRKE